MTKIAAYEMNPAEDTLLFGDELRDGMLVMPADEPVRFTGHSEDARIRAQRFCQVTRLRVTGGQIAFIGVWVDGHQKAFTAFRADSPWIVKSQPDDTTAGPDTRPPA